MPSANWPSMLSVEAELWPSRIVKSAMTFGKPQIVGPRFQGERLVDGQMVDEGARRMQARGPLAIDPGGLTIT